MKRYIVYATGSLEVLRSGTCQDSDLALQPRGAGEAVIAATPELLDAARNGRLAALSPELIEAANEA